MSDPRVSTRIGMTDSGIPNESQFFDPTGAVLLDTSQVGGGLPSGGSTKLRGFTFSYNTAGIATGKQIYVPTAGDFIVAGWVEILTLWDVGLLTDVYSGAGTSGLFGTIALLPRLSAIPDTVSGGWHMDTGNMDRASIGSSGLLAVSMFDATPLTLYVNTTGAAGGGAGAATQGQATLYLLIASPTTTVLT